jgi:hypothetical protein
METFELELELELELETLKLHTRGGICWTPSQSY